MNTNINTTIAALTTDILTRRLAAQDAIGEALAALAKASAREGAFVYSAAHCAAIRMGSRTWFCASYEDIARVLSELRG